MLNKVYYLLLLMLVMVPVEAQVLDDPTRPANTAAQSAASVNKTSVALQLEAVMQLGAARTAVISGKVVRLGDTIDGAVVKEINPRSVVIAHDDNGVWKTMTLRVSQQGNVKSNAAENY